MNAARFTIILIAAVAVALSLKSISAQNFGGPNGNWCNPMGCFQDSDSRILTVGPKIDSAMSIDMCHNICVQQGFRYYGLQHLNACWCAHELNRMPVSVGGCNVVCGGNNMQFCGGIWQLQLYDCGTGGISGQNFKMNG